MAYRRGLESKEVGWGSRILPDPGVRTHLAAAAVAGGILAAVAHAPGGDATRNPGKSEQGMILGELMVPVERVEKVRANPEVVGVIDCAPPVLSLPDSAKPEPVKRVKLEFPL